MQLFTSILSVLFFFMIYITLKIQTSVFLHLNEMSVIEKSVKPLLCLPSRRPSDGPDLLEGHGADGHGADGVSGRHAVPVPAQYHHRALHRLRGRHVLHHLGPHLLQGPLHPQLGRRGASLQVRGRDTLFPPPPLVL